MFKIPTQSKNTILIARKYKAKFESVKLQLDYSDTTKNNYNKWAGKIKISGEDEKLNGCLIINNDGKIDLKDSRDANGKLIDRLYARVPLLTKGPLLDDKKYNELINVNLLFDKKIKLVNDLKTKGVLIHGFILFDFIESDVLDIEFGNWEILPALDLKTRLKN